MRRELRVKCLVLDHDDTVVRSTPEINYPAFKKALEVLRPDMELSYEQFIEWNFIPGFSKLCSDILGFTEKEMAYQEGCWRASSEEIVPSMYEGFVELLQHYTEAGGIVCVASHSLKKTIERDYQAAKAPMPECIFDWECEYKKPHPYALNEIMRIYNLKPQELLMVDDLKPGYDMAVAVGVPFAFAGWSDNRRIPMIHQFMQAHSDYYLENVGQLEVLLYK